ncbi:uncharacterized protein B0I36DRAFT_350813 [Microdochium trichocladiopsis]|uniref:Uncharacterized protein n=1 Tax=Microdochium trichocladiopsis TaxID=1682393 RepID=A0A9P9BNC5_9PEZI|nr:uncharacterized protein B0I36DRAFT_350813 [Microdochium trichocladiopsis]KAH7027249.1 hypothetical protein B0I36DRAFT_350813 [Microdochium trichocladiopsis]
MPGRRDACAWGGARLPLSPGACPHYRGTALMISSCSHQIASALVTEHTEHDDEPHLSFVMGDTSPCSSLDSTAQLHNDQQSMITALTFLKHNRSLVLSARRACVWTHFPGPLGTIHVFSPPTLADEARFSQQSKMPISKRTELRPLSYSRPAAVLCFQKGVTRVASGELVFEHQSACGSESAGFQDPPSNYSKEQHRDIKVMPAYLSLCGQRDKTTVLPVCHESSQRLPMNVGLNMRGTHHTKPDQSGTSLAPARGHHSQQSATGMRIGWFRTIMELKRGRSALPKQEKNPSLTAVTPDRYSRMASNMPLLAGLPIAGTNAKYPQQRHWPNLPSNDPDDGAVVHNCPGGA